MDIDQRRLEQGLISEVDFAKKRAVIKNVQLTQDLAAIALGAAAAASLAADKNADPITRESAIRDQVRLAAQAKAAKRELQQVNTDLTFELQQLAKKASDEFLALETRLLESQGRFAAAEIGRASCRERV